MNNKALVELEKELNNFINYDKKNPAQSEIAIARRNGYRQALELAIKTIKDNQ